MVPLLQRPQLQQSSQIPKRLFWLVVEEGECGLPSVMLIGCTMKNVLKLIKYSSIFEYKLLMAHAQLEV